MTRKDAKLRDLNRLKAAWPDGTKDYEISRIKVNELINDIYDDFSNELRKFREQAIADKMTIRELKHILYLNNIEGGKHER